MRVLLQSANTGFEAGWAAFTCFFLGIMIPLSPFLGMFSAMFSVAIALGRQGAAIFGRNFLDAFGFGEYTRTSAAYVAWKRQQHARSVPRMLPTTGVPSSVRYPVLRAKVLDTGSVISERFAWTSGEQAFNTGWSYGFGVMLFIISLLVVIASPFIGAYLGGVNFFYIISRVFARTSGSLFTDILGITELLEQRVAFMREEIGDVPAPDDAGNNGASAPLVSATAGPPVYFTQAAVYAAPVGGAYAPGYQQPGAFAPGYQQPAYPMQGAGAYPQLAPVQQQQQQRHAEDLSHGKGTV